MTQIDPAFYAIGIVLPGPSSAANATGQIPIWNASGWDSWIGTWDLTTLTLPKLAESDTTDSSSVSTGSIVAAGGVGIAKALWVGESINMVAGKRLMYDGRPFLMGQVSLNSAYGGGAGNLTATGEENCGFGIEAVRDLTSGGANTGFGNAALIEVTTGTENTAIGTHAGKKITTGNYNDVFGCDALFAAVAVTNTCVFGAHAMFALVTGNDNTAFGSHAMGIADGCQNNTVIGSGGMANLTTGSNNAGCGYKALSEIAAGSGNSSLGGYAGFGAAGGSNNVLIGYLQSYTPAMTGSGNVLIGACESDAASYGQVTSGSNNISIGHNVAVASATGSSQLCIGNLIYGTGLSGTGATISTGGAIGFGVKAPAAAVHILKTTEQLRLGYDASNYVTLTVGAAGGLTVASVSGSTSPGFGYSNPVIVTAPTTLIPLTATRTTHSASGQYLSCTQAGVEEAYISTGEIAGYGGKLRLADGTGGGGYVDLKYNGGFPLMRTTANNFNFLWDSGNKYLSFGNSSWSVTFDSVVPFLQQSTGAATITVTSGTPLTLQLPASHASAPIIVNEVSSTSNRANFAIDVAWIDSTDATRKARATLNAYDTAAREFARGWGDGSVGRIAVAAPASAPTDAHLAASQISFYLDESGHNLIVRVKYADGTTLKTATIALA